MPPDESSKSATKLSRLFMPNGLRRLHSRKFLLWFFVVGFAVYAALVSTVSAQTLYLTIHWTLLAVCLLVTIILVRAAANALAESGPIAPGHLLIVGVTVAAIGLFFDELLRSVYINLEFNSEGYLARASESDFLIRLSARWLKAMGGVLIFLSLLPLERSR